MKFLDKFWLCFFIAIIIPLVFGLFFFHNAYKGELPFWSALQTTASSGLPLFGKLILLSTFPDLALIFLYYKAEYWSACRGTVLATALYFILSFIYLT